MFKYGERASCTWDPEVQNRLAELRREDLLRERRKRMANQIDARDLNYALELIQMGKGEKVSGTDCWINEDGEMLPF